MTRDDKSGTVDDTGMNSKVGEGEAGLVENEYVDSSLKTKHS